MASVRHFHGRAIHDPHPDATPDMRRAARRRKIIATLAVIVMTAMIACANLLMGSPMPWSQ